ncbi:MAG: hypothetical protein LBQ30_07965 [Treponema sp.]|nr:hypothetical protein [Treponema sp.]
MKHIWKGSAPYFFRRNPQSTVRPAGLAGQIQRAIPLSSIGGYGGKQELPASQTCCSWSEETCYERFH